MQEVADDLDAAVERFVGEILKSGPRPTRAAKRLAREHPPDGEELARIAAGLRSGDEGQEGCARSWTSATRAGSLRRLLFLVGAVVLVDTMFYAALTPLLPHYVDDLGLSKAGAGVLAGSYAFGALVAGIPAGCSRPASASSRRCSSGSAA